MKQLVIALGWFLIAVGTVVGGLLLWAFLYAVFTPDRTGSPDARGMATSLSALAFATVALPAFGLGGLLLWLGKAKRGPAI